MIKRIRFATAFDGADAELAARWPDAVRTSADAPTEVRPIRVTAATVLADRAAGAPHAGVALEWFTDTDHATSFDAWASGADTAIDELASAGLLDAAASHTVMATEEVRRGADWLDARWRRGGDELKHMAIARRADGLTPAAFAERWRTRAGSVGSTPIPDEARGSAYVQNHPLLGVGSDWAYDAVNEVYLDDLVGLDRRVAWFAANLAGQEDDLVGTHAFLCLRETVLLP